MIDKRELRIGNWVKGNDSPPLQVTSINESMVSCDNWGFDYEDVFSIELTPDILVKVGFEERHGCYEHTDIPAFFSIDGKEFWLGWVAEVDNQYRIGIVETLHHLQNIIKDLTGQELAINLK